VQPGQLDRRVTFQTKTEVQDDFGELDPTWVDSFTVWAKAMDVKGREVFEGNQLSDAYDIKIKVRYRSDILVTQRFTFKNDPKRSGEFFEIKHIKELGRKDGLMIMGKKRPVT